MHPTHQRTMSLLDNRGQCRVTNTSGWGWAAVARGVVLCVVFLAVHGFCGVAGVQSARMPGRSGAASDDASVLVFLRRFEQASEANDANRKAELYAERVDRYFLRTNVTREFVYRDLLDWLGRGRLITNFRLTVLSGVDGGEEKTLLVRKDAAWIDGGTKRTLSTRSQFVLRRFGDGWQIVSERDYKPGR